MGAVLHLTVATDAGRPAAARPALRVVIADDHETYRKGLARAIRRFGTLVQRVEAVGGTLDVETGERRGTTVRARLPI
jgi:ActR/RegA family two-component response regulator